MGRQRIHSFSGGAGFLSLTASNPCVVTAAGTQSSPYSNAMRASREEASFFANTRSNQPARCTILGVSTSVHPIGAVNEGISIGGWRASPLCVVKVYADDGSAGQNTAKAAGAFPLMTLAPGVGFMPMNMRMDPSCLGFSAYTVSHHNLGNVGAPFTDAQVYTLLGDTSLIFANTIVIPTLMVQLQILVEED